MSLLTPTSEEEISTFWHKFHMYKKQVIHMKRHKKQLLKGRIHLLLLTMHEAKIKMPIEKFYRQKSSWVHQGPESKHGSCEEKMKKNKFDQVWMNKYQWTEKKWILRWVMELNADLKLNTCLARKSVLLKYQQIARGWSQSRDKYCCDRKHVQLDRHNRSK